MAKRPHHSQTFVDIVGDLDPVVGEANPDGGLWPSPLRDRKWSDDAGTDWHMRGDVLEVKPARRLLGRPDVRVLHCYGMHPKEVTGAVRQALVARIEDFFEGHASPMSTFDLAEFRDDGRAVLLVVEESC